MMKQRHRLGIAVFVMGFLSVVFLRVVPIAHPQEVEYAPDNDREAAFEILGLLNAWRMDEGLTPLRMNNTLTDLAMYQATYVRTLSTIPNGAAIHVGRSGEGIMDRARYEAFNWPTYTLNEQIQIGEIAAVNDIEGAVSFWMGSPPHRATVTNPAYREIGVVALPHDYGHIFIAVLGARPSVLPALVHPETGEVYLTSELSVYGNDALWLTEPTEYRLFDDAGRPLESWQPWQTTITLPETVDDRVYIELTDGSHDAINDLLLERDIIILPGYLPEVDPLSTGANVMALPTPTPTATPEPPGPELMLVYDNRSLTAINISRDVLDMSDFEFMTDTVEFSFMWWSLETDDIFYMPSGGCVQARIQGMAVSRRLPSACESLRGWRAAEEVDTHFWTEGDFDVLYQGRFIQSCSADERECIVDLPD